MNTNRNLFVVFLFSFLLASCAKEADPKLIYERYLASIQDMHSFEDKRFEEYISNRARGVVREKTGGIKEEQLSSFLTLFKAEAVLPSDSQVTLKKADQQTAILSITANNYPEQGSKQKSHIDFIRENGWKIDKIIIETSNGDFNYKSTTY
ncbi:MAG: hypothetical protein COA75_01305 [Cellvibrionales bacterium]|nr:MAG: hypothetical protein COA75_01305 [Cellvibrionales bacterium]